MVISHEIRWVTAAPLWGDRGFVPGAIASPDIMRFASDEFMEDLTALLAKRPADLAQKVATPESHRARPPGSPSTWTGAPSTLRLFQPVHGHFNLVMASLVCRLPGLPEHRVDSAKGEEVAFVLRRRRRSDGREMAWVNDPVKGRAWSPIDDAALERTVIEHEETLPLFMVPFTEGGRTRRMWAGLVPTSSRETFVATREVVPEAFPDANAKVGRGTPQWLTDPDVAEARGRVIGGLQALTQPPPQSAQLRPRVPSNMQDLLPPPTAEQTAAEDQRARETTQLFLLDLADLLTRYVPSVMAATPPSAPAALALYNALWGPISRSRAVEALAEWAKITGESTGTLAWTDDLRTTTLTVAALVPKLDAALKEAIDAATAAASASPGALTAPPKGVALPRIGDGEARYVIRCVYRRTRCRPPHPDLVSDRSAEFTIAPFFDPDAPSRSIRIELPVDTSVKGLRKFKKTVGFLVSDSLCKQANRSSDLMSLLLGCSRDEGDCVGEVCQLSIPIITICAFIILTIFMALLNFIFWWIPLLKICFPVNRKAP